MRGLVKRILGVDRPKVIAVLCPVAADIPSCVRHARSSGSGLPIWVWCAEKVEADVDCDRLIGGAAPADAFRDLRTVWPALTVVSWSGTPQNLAFKLLPFLTPPFRFVVRNEVDGFFSASPFGILRHGLWRLKDAFVSAAIRTGEVATGSTLRVGRFLGGLLRFAWSLTVRGLDRIWSLILAALALLAPLVWPMAYALSKGRRGRSRPLPELPDTFHSTSIEVLAEDRRWRRDRIAAALASDASWIVFRHPSCFESAEPLISAARTMGAFCVARQCAYTGWRKQVIPRHPFRELQLDEIAEVLAPHSPLVALRRDAVGILGLPPAFTFGAGMAALFLRAASAGWKSYVLGFGESLAQEPAMALEDIELILRRENTAPMAPELRRGNISSDLFRPSDGRRNKPRVLVVSPYLPFPLTHGGAVRIYNLCRELAGEVDFVLACFREDGEAVHYAELRRAFREIHVVDSNERTNDNTVPQQVAEYRNSAMRTLISRLCREGAVDLVQLEYTQMAEYRSCAGNLPVLLVEHDLTFTLHQQLAAAQKTDAANRQYQLWKSFEREALTEIRHVWTMSPRDCLQAIDCGAQPEAVSVIPNGVDLQRFRPAESGGGDPTILFVGSFRHLPNLLAFEALRTKIFPLVQSRVPNVQLLVVAGPDHERAARLAGKQDVLVGADGIRIQGFVEDVAPLYRECDVVAIPLPVSAGTNIKLMEAMACGRAIVSSPLGCAGLELADGVDLFIRDLGAGFAEALVSLLKDKELRHKMGAQARNTAELRFGWDAIAGDALVSYRRILDAAAQEADKLVTAPLHPNEQTVP